MSEQENKQVEIWIRSRKLCEVDLSNEAIELFEQIVTKAGYLINEKEENGKIIKWYRGNPLYQTRIRSEY